MSPRPVSVSVSVSAGQVGWAGRLYPGDDQFNLLLDDRRTLNPVQVALFGDYF